MPTNKRLSTPVADPAQTFFQQRTLKTEAEALKKRADALATRLKDFIASNFAYTSDSGSQFIDFDDTVEVDGVKYKGLERRRSVKTPFNEEKATKILKRKGLYEKALSSFLDEEKVYLLAQEGELSAKDIDAMLDETETWALWPVKGEVE
jgi:hypothetical protein